MITIKQPHLMTRLPIFAPKYSTNMVLLSIRKVARASPIIIIEFTKAKSLIGQRFAIRRSAVEQCETSTNGKIQVYMVPMQLLDNYQSTAEMWEYIESQWPSLKQLKEMLDEQI